MCSGHRSTAAPDPPSLGPNVKRVLFPISGVAGMALCAQLSQAPRDSPPTSKYLTGPRLGTVVTFLTSTPTCSVPAPGQVTPEPGRVQPPRASDAPALGLPAVVERPHPPPPAEGGLWYRARCCASHHLITYSWEPRGWR